MSSEQLTDLYLATRDRLLQAVRWFCRLHNQRDVEEWESYADELFYEGWSVYQPRMGPFDRYIIYRTRKKLLNKLGKELVRKANHPKVIENRPVDLTGGRVFSFTEYTDGLSPAAVAAVRVVLGGGADLRLAALAQPDTAAGCRAAVEEVLLDYGWPEEAIRVAFAELAAV